MPKLHGGGGCRFNRLPAGAAHACPDEYHGFLDIMPQTPTPDDAAVIEFCQTIRQDQKPVLVPVRPVTDAQRRNCYENVAKAVRRDGGHALHGWAIWKFPPFMVEAEHHAVWVTPGGELVDVSPHRRPSVLFLPDPERVHRGRLIRNRRRALTDDPRMREFIEISDRLDEIRDRYYDGGLDDRFNFTPEVVAIRKELGRLQTEMGFLPDPEEIEEAVNALKLAREVARRQVNEELQGDRQRPNPRERAEQRRIKAKRAKKDGRG